MSHDRCPHCHTKSGLHKFYTLVLSFENWPYAFLYALVVLAFGEKFHHTSGLTSVFVVAAIIPVLVRLIQKQGCSNCGVEYRLEANSEIEKVEI